MKPGSTREKRDPLRTVLGWLVGIVMSFPVFWMALAAFKTEQDAAAIPPKFLFEPTLENFVAMSERVNYFHHAWNSIVVSFSSTLIAIALAAPAAYVMAFHANKLTRTLMLWMLSIRFMPAVGALIPIYLILVALDLIDTRLALVVITCLSNLPLIVWMLYSYFKEVPAEILEAARMDGARPLRQLWYLLIPLTLPGIASTGLLGMILAWNEAFWSINITATNSGTLALAIASFANSEGQFWAKLSAASLASIAPILIFGWITQKQLVRGLTFGAVK
ncbi:binding-protein-dependent transport systems inner membrane component [Leptothrix cholodnii SP-6]|uniref:Binding-protein-dependent transport systems inner membrane component n=1 Tax=Leptothrix cholodnii (strain ATCC 51168 / LMG 8142 / SP-6) TaxID=395495 RepID=B1Y1Y3_LEPCP|nr:carbohydrate ABC transporter permease [Leptothrix cholodnii]ACB33163.1 binding-protein-dependent transport systems inner membrane component [Leptothrix cholodnii SP-6]